jgi:hypothetical protein
VRQLASDQPHAAGLPYTSLQLPAAHSSGYLKLLGSEVSFSGPTRPQCLYLQHQRPAAWKGADLDSARKLGGPSAQTRNLPASLKRNLLGIVGSGSGRVLSMVLNTGQVGIVEVRPIQ